MRLDELVVEGFRKLDGRHVVRPAPTGITVVSGDNEEGKSTLLDALKRAFFMRHNAGGEARDAIQPRDSTTPPAVTVAFRIRDAAYRLEKRFRKGGVRLAGPDGTLEGEAAELELARLLAFDWPGRGPAKAEHMGLAGLFWVDQGTTFTAELQPSPTALRALQPALAGALAAVGRGDRAAVLMAEVRRKREQFFTAGRGQKRGELAELEQALDTLRRELDTVVAEEREVESLLERLAQTLEKRRAWLAADHLGRARAEVERSRTARRAVEALQEQAAAAGLQAQQAATELALCQERVERRRTRAAGIDAKTAERNGLLEAMAELAPSIEQARRARLAAEQAVETARAAVQAAAARRQTLGRQLTKLRLTREIGQLDAVRDAVRSLEQRALAHEAAVEAEPVSAALLQDLEAIETTLGQSRAALRAVATRLVFRPERPDATVTLDGEPLDVRQALELTAPATLAIAGFGQIEITPGGDRLGSLEAEIRSLEGKLQAGLADRRATSTRELRQRLAAKETHEREARAARARLREHLAARAAADAGALDAGAAKARARLEVLAEVALADGLDEAALDAAIEAAERLAAAAGEQLDDAVEHRNRTAEAEAELAKIQEQQSFAEARLQDEIARLEDESTVETRSLDDAALDRALAAAAAAADHTAAAAALLARELARADPDQARTAAELAARREQQLAEEGRRLDREVHELEAELRGRGAQGIGDRRARLEGELELTRRRHARLVAEAEAWRLLDETLSATDRARQDALVAPLEARMRPYLQQLLGDAGLGFEPTRLQLDRLERAGTSEPFANLSVGTREQLAVLVRLAIGDLLAEATGESPPLILDDALVYADAVRLARMKTILATAAARQQIIVLTCRKEDYLGLDARYLGLEDCRSESFTTDVDPLSVGHGHGRSR